MLLCSSTVIDCYRDWPLLSLVTQNTTWAFEVMKNMVFRHKYTDSLHICDVEEQETVLESKHPSEYRHAISICNILWKKDLG